MACKDNFPCDANGVCETYDLCEVRVTNVECGVVDKIVCEGFTFTSKVDVETLRDSSCMEGYGYRLSDVSYEWEIQNPCDRSWFDRRFVQQQCDKYSMSITGYAQSDCGDFEPMETLEACVIEETGREYGKGIQRSLKGQALRHIILKGGINSKENGVNIYSRSAFNESGSGVPGSISSQPNNGFTLLNTDLPNPGTNLSSNNSFDFLTANNALLANNAFSGDNYNSRRAWANKILRV